MPLIDEYRLTDRVALVAGDGGGYLPFLTAALAEAGARVRVAAPSLPLVEDSLTTTLPHDPTALGTVADFSSEQGVDEALRRLLGARLQVDILVNSFRVEHATPTEQLGVEEWDKVFQRQVRAVFLLCRSVGKGMVARGRGRVINVISGLAERGMINSAAACASQGAMLQLTRALALEWGPHEVRVNAIGLGWFSPREQSPEEAQKEQLVRYIPLRRRGHPRDIGPLLVFLASDACDYTTGQPIYLDGGLMAHP